MVTAFISPVCTGPINEVPRKGLAEEKLELPLKSSQSLPRGRSQLGTEMVWPVLFMLRVGCRDTLGCGPWIVT